MRLILSSDWHLDARTCGVERRADVERAVMEGPVKAAVEEKADLFCFLGDLCDPGGRSAVHDAAFPLRVVCELWEAGIRSVWVAGNHDCVLDTRGYTTLDPLATVLSAEVVVAKDVGWAYLAKERVVLLLLPWLPPASRPAVDEGRIIAEAFAAGSQYKVPVVALGHRTLPGVIPGSEAGELARSGDHMWPEDVVERAAISCCGHHHEPGTYPVGSGVVHVPGSIVRLTFADAGSERGFIVAEVS